MSKPFCEKALREKAKRYAILAARPEGMNIDEMLYARRALEIEVYNAYFRGATKVVSELRELLEKKEKEKIRKYGWSCCYALSEFKEELLAELDRKEKVTR